MFQVKSEQKPWGVPTSQKGQEGMQYMEAAQQEICDL